MSMMHDICFDNLHEDTVDRATLYLPNKVLAHPHAFLFESLRSRKGKANGCQRRRCDPDQDTESQEELNEGKRIFQEKTEKLRKQPDL